MNVRPISFFQRPKGQSIIFPMVCLLVALAFSFTHVPVAHAAEFNPGCTDGVGDAAQLQAAVTSANSNAQSDSINLGQGCTYTLTATLAFSLDGGNPLTINGNGATISGDKQFTVINVGSGALLSINRVKIKGGNSTTGNGGGIINAGVLNLTTVTLAGNKSTTGAGGIVNTGTVHITDSTLSGNKALGTDGGGILNSGTVTLTNSTMFGNKAVNGSGGGIANTGTVTLTNTTLSNNRANAGGGIFNNAGVVNLGNTIIANSVGGDCSNGGTITPSGGNLIEDGSCSVDGALSGDPKLGKQAGSPAHLPLMPGSKAIDAGDNGVCADPDQRGKIRPQDGDGNKSKVCDLGSYEKSATTGVELLTNGGFESGTAPWAVKNGSGDAIVCKPALAYTGNCAFAFKGNASEKATLVQTINVTNRNFNNGDVVRLSMMVKATHPDMQGNIEIQVLYPGQSTPGKTKLSLRRTNGYEEFNREISHLDPGLMTITLRFNHKSKAGTVYVDAISLRHVKSGQLLVPLPPAGQ